MKAQDLPSYSQLTHVPNMPQGCAWGLWDTKDEKGTTVRDQIGTLNLLTPEVILSAKSEIQLGLPISLNLPLQHLSPPLFGRQQVGHTIKQLDNELEGFEFGTNEDVLHFNTQSSSQWDGLKHYCHQGTRLFYHGMKWDDVPTADDNGIHHWHRNGGIVGRGVLLDWARWAGKQGIKYEVDSEHRIPLSELKEVARVQGLDFRPGDILIVRTGYTKWYNGLSQEQRDKKVGEGYKFIGVSADEEETIPWLWDTHFAAIASDTAAFETCPPLKIHEHALAFWGMPIGELWDLERLSEICAEHQRWSFFLTSAPLNVIGGVASPPNVIAIL